MSKEKKYRFYFSQKQSDIDEDMWDIPTRFVFVKTPNGYKQYSECCSLKGSKCNWEDAKLVYETDDNPEIITHEAIPKLIEQLEQRLSNCIEPKFKVGQEVWVLHKNLDDIVETEIESICIEIEDGVIDVTYYDIDGIGFGDYDLFATEEEAKAKLEEMQDGN